MYAIVDIETTGGHASANGITEIAVFIHDGKAITHTYQTLVNPYQKIPTYITALTGISNAMVASAPGFDEIASGLYDMLKDKIFIAHNVNFDYSFIKHHLKNQGYHLQVKKICTVRLSRRVITGLPSYSLGNLCRHAGIHIEDRHRAAGDARATVTLFEKLLQQGAASHIDDMLKKSSSEQWLPMHLDKKVISALPACPGVYYFHDVKGKIIYVGKAINIRKRVSSHFTHFEPGNRRQQFLRLIAHISHKPCASELHALVLESTEIKRLWPKYNYSQKQPAQKFGLYCFEDNRGYLRLAIDRKKKNFPGLYYFNMMHEGIVMLNKMADEFCLHPKLCFIDKTPFEENEQNLLDDVETYNRKVKNAIAALNEKLPNFAVVDEGVLNDEKLCLLIERGSFYGMGYIPAGEKLSDLYSLKAKITPYADNDFIRNSIYAFADANPKKRVDFNISYSGL